MRSAEEPAARIAFHERARRRRIELGLTQSELAERVGCSQSAVSMFEHGHGDVLAQDRLERLAETLGLDPSEAAAVAGEGEQARNAGRREVWKFCPQAECPANVPYMVGGRLCLRPTFRRRDAGSVAYCPECGEVLEAQCPNPDCRAPAEPGAFCSLCGAAYVSAVFAPRREPADPAVWAEMRRRTIAEIRALTSG